MVFIVISTNDYPVTMAYRLQLKPNTKRLDIYHFVCCLRTEMYVIL